MSHLVTNFFVTIINLPHDPASKWVAPGTPLFRNNQAAHTACLAGALFHNVVDTFRTQHPDKNSPAWTWTEENDKPGFISQQPGSVLFIPVTNSETTSGVTQGFSMGIAYLRSYHDVGIAEISCEGSCICTASRLDCFSSAQNSQQFFFHFDMSFDMTAERHKECLIAIRVSEASSTHSHQVKISGITWEEGHQGSFATGFESGTWGAARQPVPI